MNPLNIIANLLIEHDCNITINHTQKYISLKSKKRPQNILNNYRLTLRGTNANIARVNIKRDTTNNKTYFSTDKRILLSVDLHNPRSLKDIQDWLETI